MQQQFQDKLSKINCTNSYLYCFKVLSAIIAKNDESNSPIPIENQFTSFPVLNNSGENPLTPEPARNIFEMS